MSISLDRVIFLVKGELLAVQDTESSRGQFMRSCKEAPARHRSSKDVKSFSHELGLRKSHPQVLPRPHSVNNLEVDAILFIDQG